LQVFGGSVTRSYYPYGEERSGPVPEDGGSKFATYLRDAESGGLDYAMNRYYHAGTARFATPDLITSREMGNPTSWNHYSYVLSEPITFTDQTGLRADVCADQIDSFGMYECQARRRATGRDVFFLFGFAGTNPEYPLEVVMLGTMAWVPTMVGGAGSAGVNSVVCPPVPNHPMTANVRDNIGVAQTISRIAEDAQGQRARSFSILIKLRWFYEQVRNKGPWDYKQNKAGDYQEFGNFNYGATGAALGLELDFLLRGAGWAQSRAGTSRLEWGEWYQRPPYGDDPKDQEQIKRGYNYFSYVQAGCSDGK
jgi:RHS repeat-associated protein